MDAGMSRSSYFIFALVIFVTVTVPPYVGLVLDGSLQPPNIAGINRALDWLSKSTPVGGGLGAVVVVVVLIALAAIAPMLYAIASGEILTIVVSTTLTLIIWGLVFNSTTVFDVILASIIYMANLVSTAVMYLGKLLRD